MLNWLEIYSNYCCKLLILKAYCPRVQKPQYPFYDQNGKNQYPILWSKQLKNHTLWGHTYLLYTRSTPLPGGCLFENRCTFLPSLLKCLCTQTVNCNMVKSSQYRDWILLLNEQDEFFLTQHQTNLDTHKYWKIGASILLSALACISSKLLLVE